MQIVGIQSGACDDGNRCCATSATSQHRDFVAATQHGVTKTVIAALANVRTTPDTTTTYPHIGVGRQTALAPAVHSIAAVRANTLDVPTARNRLCHASATLSRSTAQPTTTARMASTMARTASPMASTAATVLQAMVNRRRARFPAPATVSTRTTRSTHEVEHDDELEVDHLPEDGSSESHIDDPIRMYLMQMGEIPMLSRADEIASAARIEDTRTRFRRLLLGQRLRAASGRRAARKGAATGELRLDRTIEISRHQHGRKEAHAQAAGAEPGHDQAPAAAEPGRLPHRPSDKRVPRPKSRPPGAGSSSAATRSSAWSRS